MCVCGGEGGDAWQMLQNYRNCSMVAELYSLLIAVDGPCYMQGSNTSIVMTNILSILDKTTRSLLEENTIYCACTNNSAPQLNSDYASVAVAICVNSEKHNIIYGLGFWIVQCQRGFKAHT